MLIGTLRDEVTTKEDVEIVDGVIIIMITYQSSIRKGMKSNIHTTSEEKTKTRSASEIAKDVLDCLPMSGGWMVKKLVSCVDCISDIWLSEGEILQGTNDVVVEIRVLYRITTLNGNELINSVRSQDNFSIDHLGMG